MLSSIIKNAIGIVLLCFLTGPTDLCAQNTRDVETPGVPVQFKEEPQSQKKISKRKAKKQLEKTYSAYFNRLVKEYEERMEANSKRYQKLAKELRKPQYVDPSYFGHKKPPRKRKIGKRKLCKECHMWH